MKVNEKKSRSTKNKTNYFDPSRSRTSITYASPDSYQFKVSKQEGYENRLFYEYMYCESVDGQTMFFTLTYNNKNVPRPYGFNTFDYNDLRDLFTGGFNKYLLRNYGTKVKYFCGAELGEGKGERGEGRNPHYHVLFFLRPAEDPRYPYQKIDPVEFRSLLRLYWQGFDQDIKWTDYRLAKKGIVSEGKYGIRVTGWKAVTYCAKYVTKDVGLKNKEFIICNRVRNKLIKTITESSSTLKSFWDRYIVPTYNIPLNCTIDSDKRKYKWSNKELFSLLIEDDELLSKTSPCRSAYAETLIKRLHLYSEYKKFCDQLIEEKVQEKLNEYRNRYCNKCRISQGVGDYALEFIDPLDPVIRVPAKNGFKGRPINLHYYRKLYCDVVKDASGQNVYVLNKQGQEFKKQQLPYQLEKLENRTMTNLSLVTEDLYDDAYHSDINTNCFVEYNEFKKIINTVDIKNIVKKYAEYKLVYENRFFQVKEDGVPSIDVISDYSYFITPTVGEVRYSRTALDHFLEVDNQGYVAYNTHPYFLSDSFLFPVFDMLADYFFVKADDKTQEEQERLEKVRKFHIAKQINDIYNYE